MSSRAANRFIEESYGEQMSAIGALEPRYLRTFMAIVEAESFTRAAKRLGLSQPAISQQMTALERELNVKVLHRTGAGVKPTLAGQVLEQYARQILRKAEEAQRMLAEFDAEATGSLSIGAPLPVTSFLLAPVISEFRLRFAKCELRLEGGHTKKIVTRLLASELDVGIVLLPLDEPQLRIIEIGTDEMMAIAPPSHAWSARRHVRPQDFAEQELILWGPRAHSGHSIQKMLLDDGIFPHVAMSLDSLDPVPRFVSSGLGVAVAPHWAVLQEEQSGEIIVRPIGKTGMTRRWAIAFREHPQRAQELSAFVRICVDILPSRLAPESVPQERIA